MLRRMRIEAVLARCALVVLGACAHGTGEVRDDREVAKASEQPAAASGASAASPEVLEVRVLTVAFQGVRGPVAAQTRSEAQALERARMLASMAREGEKLAQLVPDYSDRAGAHEDRGVMNVRTAQPAPFDAEFVQTALALPVGGVSQPLRQSEGYVIIERMKDPLPGPLRVSAKHILIGYVGSARSIPGVTRSEAEALALAEQVSKLAREPNADWDALAGKYTDEAAGKKTGGDLGNFGRGQMVPAFENAAFALPVGEISTIVKSPFGFHIIRRYE